MKKIFLILALTLISLSFISAQTGGTRVSITKIEHENPDLSNAILHVVIQGFVNGEYEEYSYRGEYTNTIYTGIYYDSGDIMVQITGSGAWASYMEDFEKGLYESYDVVIDVTLDVYEEAMNNPGI